MHEWVLKMEDNNIIHKGEVELDLTRKHSSRMRTTLLPTVEGGNVILGWRAVNMLQNEHQQKEVRMLGKSLLRVSSNGIFR